IAGSDFQPSSASAAESIAPCTSASEPSGTVPTTSPVAGLVTSKRSSDSAPTQRPPIRSCSSLPVMTAMSVSLLVVSLKLTNRVAPVDDQGGPDRRARLWRNEVRDRVGDLLGLDQPAVDLRLLVAATLLSRVVRERKV